MAPTRVYRRVEHGTEIELALVHEEGNRVPHYIDRRFDTPLPPGWRVESDWHPNWDGGPNLRRDMRVLDSDEPFDAAFLAHEDTMRRAEQLALALVEHMRVWGAREPRLFVWQRGATDAFGSARVLRIRSQWTSARSRGARRASRRRAAQCRLAPRGHSRAGRRGRARGR